MLTLKLYSKVYFSHTNSIEQISFRIDRIYIWLNFHLKHPTRRTTLIRAPRRDTFCLCANPIIHCHHRPQTRKHIIIKYTPPHSQGFTPSFCSRKKNLSIREHIVHHLLKLNFGLWMEILRRNKIYVTMWCVYFTICCVSLFHMYIPYI